MNLLVFLAVFNSLITMLVGYNDYNVGVRSRRQETKGLCNHMVSYYKSRSVPYFETYRVRKWGIFYNTKVRMNYRTEYEVAFREEKRCCAKYRMSRDDCVPICDPDCVNSDCVLPDVCVCHADYYKHEALTNFGHICVPACNMCPHGKCNLPNVCECDPEYRMNELGTCQPICSNDCESVNAYCSAPEECTCKENYKQKPDSEICTPICQVNCVNAECSAPDECTCNAGYERNSENPFVCDPKCDGGCMFGICVAPNTCECHPGYRMIDNNVCEPVCSEPCQMGICISPETCHCNDGYGKFGDSQYVCEPICEKACVNGTCTGPATCTCHDGFRLSGDETMQHVCEPVCDITCEPYGHCVAPNTCICFDGYQLSYTAVVYDVHSICQPICTEDCKNGYCSSPGVCSCYSGYQSRPDKPTICEPICDSTCVNGYCHTPNVCECNPGYQYHMSSNNYCEPLCQPPCENGLCTAPNECTCHYGHDSHPLNSSVCVPSCGDRCHFGTCVAPNVCNCNDGYTLNEVFDCVPICKNSCGDNGACVAPDMCRCLDGYRFVGNETSFDCAPVCEFDCVNGTCESPAVCTCDKGFEKDEEGRCKPFCASCGNGTCASPGVCECNDGYVLIAQGNRSVCELSCGECTNGKCVAGLCECDVGFVRNGDNDTGCVSACKENCNDRGLCVAENRTCECYYGWSGSHCDQPMFCVVVVDEDSEYKNATSIADSVNDTIVSVNDTIVSVFASSPLCYNNCLDEIGNETLCFDGYRPNGAENDSIACLMSTESICYTISAQHATTSGYITTAGIVGIVVATTAIVAVTFLLIRKHRSRRFSLGDTPTVSARSRASLLPDEDSNL